MSDDLIERLRALPKSGWEDPDEKTVLDAATALAEAQAEIARLRDQVGDWIVRADEANARADRMEAALNDIYRNVDRWNTLQISSRIRAALTDKPDAGEGE